MIIDNSNVYQAYDKKCVSALYAAQQLDGTKNLILGMSVAMPPGLMTGVAVALKNNDIAPLNIYYMHGSEVLKNTLLSPEMKNLVTPHPLFMSAHDREAIKRMGEPNCMQFVPATFHQVGRSALEFLCGSIGVDKV